MLKWTAAKKKALVMAYRDGTLTEREINANGISTEEFNEWVRNLEKHGIGGLMTTKTTMMRRK